MKHTSGGPFISIQYQYWLVFPILVLYSYRLKLSLCADTTEMILLILQFIKMLFQNVGLVSPNILLHVTLNGGAHTQLQFPTAYGSVDRTFISHTSVSVIWRIAMLVSFILATCNIAITLQQTEFNQNKLMCKYICLATHHTYYTLCNANLKRHVVNGCVVCIGLQLGLVVSRPAVTSLKQHCLKSEKEPGCFSHLESATVLR